MTKKKQTAPWEREESRIYKRDIFFLFLTVFLSIALAEFFLVHPGASPVDRIYNYLLIFIPLGTINFIAHYYYRNRRIRATGSLRSSLRYRLSIAFMLVSVIPSIPIFLLSSSMVEILVEEIFHVDVARAVRSAGTVINHYRQREESEFFNGLRAVHPELFAFSAPGRELVNSLFESGLLDARGDYGAIEGPGGIRFESASLYQKRALPVFVPITDTFSRAEDSLPDRDMILYRFRLVDGRHYLLVGRRINAGMEKDVQYFYSVYNRLRDESLWNIKIPSNIRLTLGIIYIFMICCALVISTFIARKISMPIVTLAAATRAVTDGELDTRIDIKSEGELEVLIESFNQMTEELRTLRNRLLHTQRVAAWQEVAKRLAHEIKNPLTPIQLSADRMLRRLSHPEKGDLENVVQTGASTIVEQVKTLKQMVEEFANFARLPSARPQPASLETIVSEAANLFRGVSGVSIEMSLSGDLPTVNIDKNIIIGLINNLVKNAVEAIESIPEAERERQGKILVSTRLHREGGRNYVMLKVEDSGPGVDDSLRDRIFEPYFSTKGEHGSGLGLALVERAALEHNARIQVGRSDELGGAEFRILFPVRGGKESKK